MKERKNQERLSVDAKLDARDAAAVAQQEAAAQVSADRLAASAGYVGEDEPTSTDFSRFNDPDLEKLLSLNPRSPNPALIDEILMRSTPRTEALDGIDSDFDADLSPDMVAELNRLEKRRTARGISQGRNDFARGLLDGANITGGVLADGTMGLLGAGLNAAGYMTGGGEISDNLFKRAQMAVDISDSFTADGKTMPRLINPSEGPTVEAAAELERAEIEQDSIRAYADAVLSGNTDLFAEGSVADGERSAFSELDRSSPVGIGLSPNELAAEEFSQRPDTQDPLTDERLIDIVMAASADGPPPVDTGLSPSELAAIAANNTELGYTDDQMGLTTGFEQPYLTDDDMGLTTGPDFKYVAPNVSSNVSGTAIGMAVPETDVNVGPEIVNDDRNYLDKIIDRFNTNFDEFRNRDRGPEETEEKVDDLNAGEIESEAAKQRGTLPVEVVAPEVVAPEAVTPTVDTDELQKKIAKKPGDANTATADALLTSGGIDTSNMSVKDQTVAMKKMLTDLMGQTDADEKEQFWMNMAMVGFGIASGESSDAMKNIADGLLAGTAQISKNTTDKKARDDKFTLTAFGEVLADKRAREKFGQDKILAGIRSSSTSEYTPARERSRIKEVILSDPTMFAQLFGEGSIIDPIKLKKYLDKIVPGSSGTIETITTLDSDSDSDSDSKLPVVNSAAGYNALEVGQYFMQMKDGVLKRFKKT